MKEERDDPIPELVDDDDVGRLVAWAGRRPEVPEAEIEALFESVHEEWRTPGPSPRGRGERGRWWIWGAGLAAAAVLVAVLGWRLVLAAPAATVAFVAGGVTAASAEIEPGVGLRDGTHVTTAQDGRAALRLAGGFFVRLDQRTRARLVSGSVIELEEGALYAESIGNGATIEVRTPWGMASNLGTRFEVRLRPTATTALRLRVRDGAVRLATNGHSGRAGRGEELSVSTDGSLTRTPTRLHGADWQWISAAAATLAIEGATLDDFLDWITSENGWTLEAVDGALDGDVPAIRLRGEIEGLDPEKALEAVLPGCGLSHRLADGVLFIESAL